MNKAKAAATIAMSLLLPLNNGEAKNPGSFHQEPKDEIANVLSENPTLPDTSKTYIIKNPENHINGKDGAGIKDKFEPSEGIDVHGIVQINSKNIAPDYNTLLSDKPNGVLHLDFSKAFTKNQSGIKLGVAIDRVQELAKNVNPAASGNVYNPYFGYSHKLKKGSLDMGAVGEFTQMDNGLRCFTPNIYGNYTTNKGWMFGTKIRGMPNGDDVRKLEDVAIKLSAAKTCEIGKIIEAFTFGINAWYMSNPGLGNPKIFSSLVVCLHLPNGVSLNLSLIQKDNTFGCVGFQFNF